MILPVKAISLAKFVLSQATDTANLGILVRFEIPQNIPFGTSISVQDLSSQIGLPEDIIARTVRYSITNGLFSEPSPGYFRHTSASASLARNKHIQDIALFSTHEISSIVVKLADSLKLQQERGRDGPAAAFNLAYPSFDNAFEYFDKNADTSARYHSYLNGRVKTSRWMVRHLTTTWDWASVESGTIIDVRVTFTVSPALGPKFDNNASRSADLQVIHVWHWLPYAQMPSLSYKT